MDLDSGVNENFQNLAWVIREQQSNKKVVNQVIQNATLLSQLGDTNIINPVQNQILSYDGSKWNNSNLSLMSSQIEVLRYRSLTNNNQLISTVTTQMGINNTIPIFTNAANAVGSCLYDQSLSTNIIQTVNNSLIKFLKSGKYEMQFNFTSNNTNNNLLFYMGLASPLTL